MRNNGKADDPVEADNQSPSDNEAKTMRKEALLNMHKSFASSQVSWNMKSSGNRSIFRLRAWLSTFGAGQVVVRDAGAANITAWNITC